jgi:hypothetical protein
MMNNHPHKFEFRNELLCVKCERCFCLRCCKGLESYILDKYTSNNKFDAFSFYDDFVVAIAYIMLDNNTCEMSEDEWIIKNIIE